MATVNARFKKGQRPFIRTEFIKGSVPWNKGKKGIQVSTRKGKKLAPLTTEHKEKISLGLRGHSVSDEARSKMRTSKNPNWKGGITKERFAFRNSFEYKKFVKEVLGRDDYTCQTCKKNGGDLHVDHIKSFKDFPDLRLNTENGRTLCIPCHFLVTFKKVIPLGSKWGHYSYSNTLN